MVPEPERRSVVSSANSSRKSDYTALRLSENSVNDSKGLLGRVARCCCSSSPSLLLTLPNRRGGGRRTALRSGGLFSTAAKVCEGHHPIEHFGARLVTCAHLLRSDVAVESRPSSMFDDHADPFSKHFILPS